MKSKLILVLVPFLALTACKSMSGKKHKAEAPPPAEAASMEPSAEEMAAWQAYATPSAEHEKMAAQCGDWVVKARFWMEPGAPVMESQSEAKLEMIMGGRYQKQTWHGAMMGMPFEGMSLAGYDNATHEFTSVWIDSMGTGTSVTKGGRRKDGVIEMTGEMVDPMGGTADVRMFLTEAADGSPSMEMWVKSPRYDREFKSMELVYTRK